jgi:hypothetical protein
METVVARPIVIEALDRRFQEALIRVPVLRRRAEAEGITRVRSLEDVVPLLFPHTVYKSYPASLLTEGRWVQMNRWLDSTSADRIDVEVSGVSDVDGWIERLGAAGHFITSSSGTTGKSSFLHKSQADLDAATKNMLDHLRTTGVAGDNSWHMISLGADNQSASRRPMQEEFERDFARSDNIAPFPSPPQAEGHYAFMTRMTGFRRAMAEGTVTPEELQAHEAEAMRRDQETKSRLSYYAAQVLERPGDSFLIGTMMALAWRFVEELRELGAKPGDLTGDNAIFMAGGTKGVVLPPDHVPQILSMLHIDPTRFVQFYSMQEINLGMPRCIEDRYHVPDQLLLLVLDEPGEKLESISDCQTEGRAAFFDVSVDGRWGGIISGDRIRAEYGMCSCGRPGPTVFSDIVRYSGLSNDDKITCAGTMDAYVRGLVED